MGDYTRLDETIMVLKPDEAERKGAAVGFMIMKDAKNGGQFW